MTKNPFFHTWGGGGGSGSRIIQQWKKTRGDHRAEKGQRKTDEFCDRSNRSVKLVNSHQTGQRGRLDKAAIKTHTMASGLFIHTHTHEHTITLVTGLTWFWILDVRIRWSKLKRQISAYIGTPWFNDSFSHRRWVPATIWWATELHMFSFRL